MKRNFVFATGLMLGVVLCAMLVSLLWMAPVDAQSNLTTFTNLRTTGDMTVGDDLAVVGDLSVGGDVSFTDALTVSGDMDVSGGINAAGSMSAVLFNVGLQDPITVTDGSTITPTGTLQPILSEASTGTSSIVPGDDGDLLVLVNVGSNTITITDTGTLLLATNAQLGANDSLSLVAIDGDWVEVSRSNN